MENLLFADRLIQTCGGLQSREMKEQVLDSMDIERERGITIKAQTVRLNYKHKDGKTYILNIMDTPGHVDFSYEVSRSLDAAQSIQAQTISNLYLALENDLEIIPVLNKVDLPSANPELVTDDIVGLLGCNAEDVIPASAKTGIGIEAILKAIINKIPSPKSESNDQLKALLVDSWYDSYLGVVILVRIIDGYIKRDDEILMMSNGAKYKIDKVGVFTPKPISKDNLGPGEMGFIVTGIKSVSETKVGDTITLSKNPITKALPGFKPSKPVVFCGLFPVDSSDYGLLRDSLGKLSLNDSSLIYEAESSSALGLGFRCGFLGLLHLEIAVQRLDREYNLNLITTTPTLVYKLEKIDERKSDLQNPSSMPEPNYIKTIKEPWIDATLITPDEYLGSIIKLCEEKRGLQKNLSYSGNRAVLNYELPLNEVVFDFYDRLKSVD